MSILCCFLILINNKLRLDYFDILNEKHICFLYRYMFIYTFSYVLKIEEMLESKLKENVIIFFFKFGVKI